MSNTSPLAMNPTIIELINAKPEIYNVRFTLLRRLNLRWWSFSKAPLI
jgi:hypothetical protein